MDMEFLRAAAFFMLVAFLPSLLWMMWLVRKGGGGPGAFSLAAMFIWGAVFAVIIAMLLEYFAPGFSPWAIGTPLFFMVVVVAPLAEEFAKPLGLRIIDGEIGGVDDGIILGATAGLGFAATENLLYGQAALAGGDWAAFWLTVALRGFAACALHAAATGMTGRGYALASVGGSSKLIVVPFFILAVLMHALYNYLAIQGTVLAFTGAMALALAAIVHTGRSVE